MLKERCMYCGLIFTDEDKKANKVTTITKPAISTPPTGGSKIIQKPIGYHCTKRCFKGQARTMYPAWVEAELRDGVWVPAIAPKGSGLKIRNF